ncbi:MAG: bph2 2 [Gammaproteobacteria bacterium]|nr:bph2 2 [Gammaproteobacteria bacterium]
MAAKRKTAKRKTTAKRTTRAKSTQRRTTARRKTTTKAKTTTTVAVKKKTGLIRTALSKSQTMAELAECTGLSRKQVCAVMDALTDVICRHVKPGAAGQFTLPGLAKVVIQNKKATKARKGVNPFTGEPTTFKAKPARNVVKIRALKKLKEMAAK